LEVASIYSRQTASRHMYSHQEDNTSEQQHHVTATIQETVNTNEETIEHGAFKITAREIRKSLRKLHEQCQNKMRGSYE